MITLTAIDKLLHDACTVGRVLIIAPKKVAEATWQDEAAKWSHLQGLGISTVLGSAKQRTEALSADAEVYITNRDNVAWLVEHFGRCWPFDMVVLDEASSFKHHNTQRFKALKRVRPRIHRVVELTGTPAPKDYLDLWAQVYLLDQGIALGRYFTHYRQAYFEPDKRNGQQVFSWRLQRGADKAIQASIADQVISIKAADHLQMPALTIEDIPVVLDATSAAAYKRMELKCLLEVDDGTKITAMQAATLTGKLLQLCNGSLYDTEHLTHRVHHCKLDAFNEIIDALGGQHALVFYSFEFDREQLLAELATQHKDLVACVLTDKQDAADWNAGKIDILLAQPASCAYGLNLQAGGHHIIWYSLPWSLELYEQANARLYRQGQAQPVFIHRLMVKGGADEMVASALARKNQCQDALMQGLKARIDKAKEINRK